MKIIHIARDSIHTRFIIDLFEKNFPKCNELYIIKKRRESMAYASTELKEKSLREIDGAIDMWRRSYRADLIIAHGMTAYAAMLFILLPGKAKKFWSGWGYDYYGSVLNPNFGLLMPLTKNVISFKIKSINFLPMLRSIFKIVITNVLSAKAAARTDYFSAPIPEDFEIFKNRFKKFSGNYCQLNYGNVSSSFGGGAIYRKGKDILIGNSASPSNNHADAFEFIDQFDLKGRRIIVPLTYGDEEYASKIIELGQKRFGEKFFPITKHMPLVEYLEVIGGCEIVFMNNLRQQALGNIGAALYGGANLILNENNPVYEFLKSRGAKIYGVNELSGHQLPEGPLNTDFLSKNRMVLDDFWGDHTLQENIKKVSKLMM